MPRAPLALVVPVAGFSAFGWRAVFLAASALMGCTHRPSPDPTPSATEPSAVANAPMVEPAFTSNGTSNSTPNSTSRPPGATAATGETIPAKAERPPADRIYAKARFAWIQPAPRASKGWLGYLGLGGSVAVKGGSLERARIQGSGSCKAWYAVEPMGYVCAGAAATVDPNDPVLAELAADAPRTDSPWPYDYAESLGAPRFRHVPSAREQEHDEWDLAEHMRLVASARNGETVDKLAGVDLTPAAPGRWGASPDPASLHELSGLVREERKWIATGSTVATTRSFEIGGRTFYVTHDHAIVPKDRLRPYPRSEFHGVEIGGDTQLPLAFFRTHERPKYRRGPDGAFALTGESWARLAWVGLTGEETKEGDRTFLATREAGLWVLASDAAVVRLTEPPSVIKQAPAGTTSGRKTWLDVSVLGGTLVAYEDAKPVFATLISPGRGGIPAAGKDPLETASTPTGTFRVDGKFVTATMVSSTNDLLVHTEVQYVQNFHGPHALHGAYWHDAWGQPKSGGCVNLAPIDAKRLFEWSEPPVPTDWYGMRSVKAMGPATVVVVHK